jgi:uncharacterized protein
MRKILLILAALAAVVLAATWQMYTVKLASTEINALAVGPTGGAVLPIKVTLLTPGDGRAYVAGVPEAGEGFGPSAQIALYVAARYSGRPYINYTALLRVLASDAQVGGPSASGYITVALFALMNNLTLRGDMAMTGIILPDGLVGPVGGVSQKVSAAAEKGIKTVLVPMGEAPGGVSGVRVVEIGTLEDAIYYLTGYRVQTPPLGAVDDSAFRDVSRNLFNAIYSYYNQTVGKGYVNVAVIERLKAEGKYYTAASLIYQGIVQYYKERAASRGTSRTLYDQALQMAREAEAQLAQTPVTINNVDLVVASYTRIYEVYLQANSTSPDAGAMYARAVTLRSWIDETRKRAYGPVLNEGALAEVARMYLDYAKAMYAYLETTYGRTLGDYATAVQLAEDLYSKGLYLASMANSIEIIAESASALMASASDKYLEVARNRALINMGRAAQQCSYTNTLPLSYLQFGDYFSGQQTGKQQALTYYIMASIYSTAMGDAACTAEGGVVYQKPSLSPETPPPAERGAATPSLTNPTGGEEKSIWIPVLIALLAVVALVYASRR